MENTDVPAAQVVASLVRRDRAMLAVSLVLDVAFHAGRAGTVSATDIADRLGSARRGLEPLLQALTRSGLLDSIRGPRGGYRLGRAPRGIRLTDVVGAIAVEPEASDGPGGALQTAVIEPLWMQLSDIITERLGALTIEDMLRRAADAGLRRPASEPLDWVI